jgi:hypothetical protein
MAGKLCPAVRVGVVTDRRMHRRVACLDLGTVVVVHFGGESDAAETAYRKAVSEIVRQSEREPLTAS